jgi:hypothetical protein
LTIVFGMTQRCYIGICKSAERQDRPKGKLGIALVLVLFSFLTYGSFWIAFPTGSTGRNRRPYEVGQKV